MQKKYYRGFYFFILITGLALLLGGCASNGVISTQRIDEGEKGIQAAREGNASLNAPQELEAAEGKLAQAREAFANEDFEKAGALAEQASIDAEYARTKASTEKNKKAVAELKKNIDTLRQEIESLSKR